MSQEIKIDQKISVTKGNLTVERKFTGLAFDMSGTHSCQSVQDIGTTDELLVIPAEVATKGWAWFRNHDSTNYVEIGVRDGGATFIPFAKLLPGEPAQIPLASSSIYAKANTATVKLEFAVIER